MSRHSNRKGVSPLIAAVLLIAFTMAVAAILTAWVTTFTQEQTEALGNKSEQQIDCSFGQIEIFDTTEYGTAGVSVAVTNTGTLEFSNTSVTALSGGSVLGKAFISSFSAGQTTGVNITDTGSQTETIRISTEKCPTVSDQTTLN